VFFEQGSAKGLFFLAKGTNPLHRTLAAKMGDAVAWWNAISDEMNMKFRPRIKEFALQLYLKNPDAYTEEQQAMFEVGLKSSSLQMKAAQMRAPIAIASLGAAPEIKEAAAASQSTLEKDSKNTWINALQVIPPQKFGNIVPNGKGGVLFKGKELGSGTLDLPFVANGEFDFASEFIEGDGAGNICFIMPIGTSSCMVLKGPDFIGIDTIKNERAAFNKTNKKITFPKGVSHKLLVSVRRGKADNSASIKVYVDGELCIEHEGDISDYSTTKPWDRGQFAFGVGNHATNFELLSCGINMVSGTIKPK